MPGPNPPASPSPSATEIRLSAVFPVSAEALYTAWLSSRGHSAFTGSKAQVDPNAGGKFTAWDGYISGETVEVTVFRRIVQKWRCTDFPDDSPDSTLEIRFEEEKGGTRLELVHAGFPKDQAKDLEKGWKEYYFKPMKKYFKRYGLEKWEIAFRRGVDPD
jgi:activator of HSP90 ATPase